MANIEQYDNEISGLEEQIDKLALRLAELNQCKAEALCPHKIGDIIPNKDGTRKAKIAKIKAPRYGFDSEKYTLFGYWIKKGGTVSDKLRELYWYDWE